MVVQNDERNLNDGSNPDTSPDLLSSSTESPPLEEVLLKLAQTMSEQNQALWALVEQTAAMIELVAESRLAEEEEQTHYLDGSLIS